MSKAPVIKVNISIKKLSQITGIHENTLYRRYKEGHIGDDILEFKIKTYSVKRPRNIKLRRDLTKLAEQTGISYKTLFWRYKQGKDYDDLIAPPKAMGTNVKPAHVVKGIIQLDLRGNVIQEFDSMIEASKALGISVDRIRNLANGKNCKYKYSYAYKLKFKD